MSVHRLFDTEGILQNTSEWSSIIPLWDGRHYHSMQYKVTGAGSIDLTVYTSHDGQNWVSNGIKADDISATTGPGGDGLEIIPLKLKPGNHIRVKATEINVGAVNLTLWFTQK